MRALLRQAIILSLVARVVACRVASNYTFAKLMEIAESVPQDACDKRQNFSNDKRQNFKFL